jgi:exopolyphosphatase / guanosine-5'-triphosphate,3'-diphosphate pyrophosphatase
MLLGVLDIGSTSARLLVVDTDRDLPQFTQEPTHTVKRRTLLGNAFEPDGSIDAAGIERVVEAVVDTMRAARDFGVEQLAVVVTATVRDATNREIVLARLERETGVRPRFLTGEDEARLAYLAARHWSGPSAGRLLLVDIGGGTTEIAAGRDEEPDFVVSLPLGAGRLTRAFLPDDPPRESQVRALCRHVHDTLAEVAGAIGAQPKPDTVIAASRTFTQLARLAGASSPRRGRVARPTLAAADLTEWIPRLASRSSTQRAELRGISRNRAQQILAGAIVAEAALRTLDIPVVRVCPWALREGLILGHLRLHVHGDVRPVRTAAGPETSREEFCLFRPA